MKDRIISVLKSINPDIPNDIEIDLLTSGMMDSFDIVNIVAELENKFSLIITAEDIIPENFKTIYDIEKMINNIKHRGE